MNNDAVDKVVDMVTIPQVLQRYGYPVKRGKRIPCPIHNGKDANFCYTDRVFHCWTCGAKGNVISFVMQNFGLNFGQSILKLNADFALGLTAKKPTLRERRNQADNRRIQEAYAKWQSELKQKYLIVAAVHSVLFRKLQHEPNNRILIDYIDKLDLWLDENTEEVRF